MAAKIDKEYQDKMVTMTKMCMKGKNMHVCIQAAGAKKGKLILAKKQSECKPKVIKALKIFTGGKEADALNDIKAPPAMGVAVGEKGILKIMIEKGPEKDKIADFAKYFITKQMKLKMVKDVELVQVEEGKLPAVSEDDDDGGKVKAPQAASQAAAASKPKPAAPGGGDFDAKWGPAKQAYQTASQTVDGQITSLQAAMAKHDDKAIQDIAKVQLKGLTDDLKVQLLTATSEVEKASAGDARKKAAKTAQETIKKVAATINSDQRIAVCDDNPFGVSVSIKKTLGPALVAMSKALNAV